MQVSGASELGVQAGEQVEAAPWRRRGIDDRADGLIRIRRVDYCLGRYRLIPIRDMCQQGATFDFSTVLGTGDDLLTRVATLGEADATNQFVVEHLRYKLILRFCDNVSDPATDR